MTELIFACGGFIAGIVCHAAVIAWWDRIKATKGAQAAEKMLNIPTQPPAA